ncbi:MAG: hypothetical protein D6730_15520 [Bacteroidetes bacterium]|nr:MAG: hypothetical protein D6730_15520 [Bacteroidota bacterium]
MSELLISPLIEHYHKTSELTYQFRRQRNRLFISLLAVIGLATLLTYDIPETNALLIDMFANLLNIEDPGRIAELKKGFPFAILQSILLIVVFYLMVNLYHRSISVSQNFHYLGALEKEIRKQLKLDKKSVAFTLDGDFYWKNRPPLLGLVKWVYMLMLGLLLLAFLLGRIAEDVAEREFWFVLIDVLLAVPTLIFFYGYAVGAVKLDQARPFKRKLEE